jgi:hypothetical protein
VPLVLQDERYLYVVSVATIVCLIGGEHLSRFRQVDRHDVHSSPGGGDIQLEDSRRATAARPSSTESA